MGLKWYIKYNTLKLKYDALKSDTEKKVFEQVLNVQGLQEKIKELKEQVKELKEELKNKDTNN